MTFLLKAATRLISFGLISIFTMLMGLALYAATLLPQLPTVTQIQHLPLNVPLRIYSSDQKLIAEYGDERRIPIALDEAPPLLLDAILVAEDDNFYHHTGVDLFGIARAALSNLRSQSHNQGASTITMQVARNFFLNPEKTYVRKLKEVLLAFSMERALTKDEILELYLNKIFLGHRAYGFAAAAQVYYGQALEDLSLPEIAMLAGLPKSPSRNNPISNLQRATERRDYVLKRMYELGRIDRLSYTVARQAPVTARRQPTRIGLEAPYIAEMARQWAYQRFGQAAYEVGYNLTVSIHSDYQKQAAIALRNGLYAYDVRHGYRGPVGRMDAAAMAADNAEQQRAHLLDQYPRSGDLLPAVVTTVGEQTFSAATRQQHIDITWPDMRWARRYKSANRIGPEPQRAADIVRPGDVVYVKPVPNGATDDATDAAPTEWQLSQLPEVGGALVCLDPDTGAILALVGGFDYYLSKFNRATQAVRQPGSNIKPFIYSAAMDNGFSPASLVSAAPIVVEDDLEGVWRPQNYSQKFFGPTRLRKALSLSLNLVSVRLVRTIGIEKTVRHLAGFGFDDDKLPRSLSLALGSIGTTPLQLAAGYAVLANGGKSVQPHLIQKIEDADNNPIAFDALPDPAAAADGGVPDTPPVADAPETADDPLIADEQAAGLDEPNAVEQADASDRRAISEQNAFLVRSMMQQVIISGTGRKALALNRSDLAGKTGTTNDFKDAWFSGFSPDVITTIYIGFDKPRHLGRRESGASAALPIWVEFMGEVLKDFPEQPPAEPPAGITSRFVNRDTGQVTASDDPNGYWEYFPSDHANNDASPAPVTPASVSESLF